MVSSEAAASVSALAASSDLVASALVESSLLPVSVPASLLSVFAGVSVWAVDCWVSAADWSSAMAVALTPATPPSIATAATTATSRLPLLPAAPPTAANHSAILFIALPVSYDRVRQSLASHLQGVTLLSKKHECVHPDRGKFLPDIEKNLGIFEKWHPRHPPYDNGLFRPCGACCSHNSGIGADLLPLRGARSYRRPSACHRSVCAMPHGHTSLRICEDMLHAISVNANIRLTKAVFCCGRWRYGQCCG